MGVPKFFRYISERYPCLSELVKEYQIPEFDNLYLDMNGIIHMCSHPDDYDPHFRISEEKIFSDIFHYIEVLFRLIKPQKLFFMAVDGVAPRAKMNQQRGRRFRSAKDAEVLEAKARERGEELPQEARFDSNCITPGTVFMCRLHEQLKYFVSQKMSSDVLWRGCKVILSGHETPGEGEHKIMDYIRYLKAQPGYSPNTRHCLYGLDADLIMLGLCTHEPHFSLLREEVRFGRKANAKRKNVPEQITFYLLHLSLMREYLELEFISLKDTLPFPYDVENIIDDWVLMGFLVGNDFIPHLPNLHINSGALPILYNAYMKILPTLDGYINEAGTLNLDRFEKFMCALATIDKEHFSEQYADLKYFQNKTGRRPTAMNGNERTRTNYKPTQLEMWEPEPPQPLSEPQPPPLTTTNKELSALIKATDDMLCDPFDSAALPNNSDNVELQLPSHPELRVFIKQEDHLLLDDVSRSGTEVDVDIAGTVEEETLVKATDDKTTVVVEPSVLNLEELSLLDEMADDGGSPYLSSEVDEDDDDEESLMDAEFQQHKTDYYMNKLEYGAVTKEVMRGQAEGYVRAIQWNLHYYYSGVCSWSWFYPHHYAPYISDIRDFRHLRLDFELGEPFQPFEQLLAVLPAASRSLLPSAYQDLMVSDASQIIAYYPQDFRTDLNGKKQEWEAVVLIPFIAEEQLLQAMQPCSDRLTSEERARNCHGPMLVYQYTDDDLGSYPAPAYFATIAHNHARPTPLTIQDIRVPHDKLIRGPYPGANNDIYYPGFPTFKHLKYTAHLEKAKVRVFDTPSQNDNMIVKIEHTEEIDIEALAGQLLGKTVHVLWPHLTEAYVVSVSDAKCRYHNRGGESGKYSVEVNKGNLWHSQKQGITSHYKERLGIDVADTCVLVHVKVLTGSKYVCIGGGGVAVEKQWAEVESSYPAQSVVRELSVAESSASGNNEIVSSVQELFPLGSVCFMLGHPHYGSQGTVIDNMSLKMGRLKVSMRVVSQPDLSSLASSHMSSGYMPGHVAAQRLSISPHLFSRMTGSLFVVPGVPGATQHKHQHRHNIGLNLKLNKRNEEIPGYTRKQDQHWLYSNKAVQLCRDYITFAPHLFTYLAKHLANDVFHESELFPNNIGEGKIQEILDWLKKQSYQSVERQKVGSQSLDVEAIKKIEEIVNGFKSSVSAKQVIMQVKPHLLYKSDMVRSGRVWADPSVTYELLDRVVLVRASDTVAEGTHGTVVGVPSDGEATGYILYNIVWDNVIGLDTKRQQRTPAVALINISHGQRVIHERATNPATNTPWYPHSAFAKWPTTPSPSPLQSQPTVNAQFSAFFQNLQKNHNKTKYKASNSTSNLQQGHTKQPLISQVPVELSCISSPSAVAQVQPQGSSDGTETLKKLLKISETPVKKQTYATGNKKPNEPMISVQDFFAHARNKEQKSSSTALYSVQLLNYCQSQHIGIPRYSYFPKGDASGSVRAQVTLPDGRTVMGGEAPNKEQATENAAKIIMSDVTQVRMPPAPPKQWCRQPQQQQQQQLRRPHTRDDNNKQLSTAAAASASATATCTPFVPLQAQVKQHRRANTHHHAPTQGVGAGVQGAAAGATAPSSAPKPRVRKSRIAANLPGLQQKN